MSLLFSVLFLNQLKRDIKMMRPKFVVIFIIFGFISAETASSDLNFDLDEFGSMNDINLFKSSLSLFGVGLGSNEKSKPDLLSPPKEDFPDNFIDYTPKTALDIIEGRPLPSQVWLFLSEKNGDFEKILPEIENLPKEFQGQILFVICNVDKSSLTGTLESVRVKKREAPTARIIYIGPEIMDIYKPAKNFSLNLDEVRSFAEQFLLKKLERLPAGEMLPEDWDQKPVKYLVADNFKQFLEENRDKRVAVKYYSPT